MAVRRDQLGTGGHMSAAPPKPATSKSALHSTGASITRHWDMTRTIWIVVVCVAPLGCHSTPTGHAGVEAGATSSVATALRPVTPRPRRVRQVSRPMTRPAAPAPPDRRSPEEVARAACAGRCVGSAVRPKLGANTSVPVTPVSWTVPNWYFDTGNSSGCASNTNSGTAPSCSGGCSGALCPSGVGPVKGGQEIITHRWGTSSPILPQTTTWNSLSSQPLDYESLVLSPVMVGGSNFTVNVTDAALGGTFLAGTVTHKVRSATGNDLQITPSSPPEGLVVGTILANVTRSSTAMIDAVASGTYTLTQPLDNAGLSPSIAQTFSEDDEWTSTDTLQAYQPGLLNLKTFSPSGGDADSSTTPPIAAIVGAYIPDVSGTPGSGTLPISSSGISFQMFSSFVSPQMTYDGWLSTADYVVPSHNELVNCVLSGGGAFRWASLIGGSSGLTTGYTRLDNAIVDGDTILHGQAEVSSPYSTVGLTHTTSTFFVGYGGYLQLYAVYFPISCDINANCGTQLWGTSGAFVDIEGAGTVELLNTDEANESWVASLTLGPTNPVLMQSKSTATAIVSDLTLCPDIPITPANLAAFGSLFNMATGAGLVSGKAPTTSTKELLVTNATTPGQLNTARTFAMVDSSTGATLVYAPNPPSPDITIAVYDTGGAAAANAIGIFTFYPGSTIEDPNAPGTFSNNPVYIRTNWMRATWYYDVNSNAFRLQSVVN